MLELSEATETTKGIYNGFHHRVNGDSGGKTKFVFLRYAPFSVNSANSVVNDFASVISVASAASTCAFTHASLKCACLIDLRGSRFSASGVTDAAGAKKL